MTDSASRQTHMWAPWIAPHHLLPTSAWSIFLFQPPQQLAHRVDDLAPLDPRLAKGKIEGERKRFVLEVEGVVLRASGFLRLVFGFLAQLLARQIAGRQPAEGLLHRLLAAGARDLHE